MIRALRYAFLSAILPSLLGAWVCQAQVPEPLGLQDFETISAQITDLYQPLFMKKGLNLTIRAVLEEKRVNAYATRDENDNAVILIQGGMLWHPLMTHDGLRAVICHELGHFIGGAPKAKRGRSSLLSWSSAEGEADYFASSKCLKSLFQDSRENNQAVAVLDPLVKADLEGACHSAQCMRIVDAGLIAARVFAASNGDSSPLRVSTPDGYVTPATLLGHSSPQCRLDTFVAGAVCEMSSWVPLDDLDPTKGACTNRPSCWYRP